jgi:hypothetical protein
MCSLTSILVFSSFNATMVVNLIIMQLAPSFLNMASIFVYLVLTHPSKTAKTNGSFDPLITSCALCFSKPPCRRHIGLNCAPSLNSSTSTPPKPFKTVLLTKPFLVHHPHMIISTYLDVVVIQTFHPLCHINSHQDQRSVCFLAISIITRDIGV